MFVGLYFSGASYRFDSFGYGNSQTCSPLSVVFVTRPGRGLEPSVGFVVVIARYRNSSLPSRRISMPWPPKFHCLPKDRTNFPLGSKVMVVSMLEPNGARCVM